MAETTEALVGKKRQHQEEEKETTTTDNTTTTENTTSTTEDTTKESTEEEKQIKKKKVEEEKETKEEEVKKDEPATENKPDQQVEEKKAEEAPKLSIFNNTSSPWSFSSFASTSSSTSSESKPFASTFGSFASTSPYSFNLSTTSSFLKPTNGEAGNNETTTNNENENTEEGGSGTGDYWSSSTYVPILQNLQPVETKTGEEDETTIYSAKAKLYAMEDTYKERGIGTLKLNKDANGNSRLIFIVDGSKRSGLNVSIFSKMTVETPTEKSIRFTAFEGDKFCTFLANMKKPEEVEQFEKNIKKRVEYLKEQQQQQQNGDKKTEQTKVETQVENPVPEESVEKK